MIILWKALVVLLLSVREERVLSFSSWTPTTKELTLFFHGPRSSCVFYFPGLLVSDETVYEALHER